MQDGEILKFRAEKNTMCRPGQVSGRWPIQYNPVPGIATCEFIKNHAEGEKKRRRIKDKKRVPTLRRLNQNARPSDPPENILLVPQPAFYLARCSTAIFTSLGSLYSPGNKERLVPQQVDLNPGPHSERKKLLPLPLGHQGHLCTTGYCSFDSI